MVGSPCRRLSRPSWEQLDPRLVLRSTLPVGSSFYVPIGRKDARAPVRRTVSQGEMPADVGRDEPSVALRERGVHAPKPSGLVFDRRRWPSFQPAPTPVRTTMATGALCFEASPGQVAITACPAAVKFGPLDQSSRSDRQHTCSRSRAGDAGAAAAARVRLDACGPLEMPARYVGRSVCGHR